MKPPLETIGPAGKLEMRRTGGVAKQGKYNPAMRGVQSPERYRDARTCPEKRVRFPRRPDSSKKIASAGQNAGEIGAGDIAGKVGIAHIAIYRQSDWGDI